MTVYVYEALYIEKWEQDRTYGLFTKKADAKKACQDEVAKNDLYPASDLRWDNTRRDFATAPAWNGNFAVWRRPVR